MNALNIDFDQPFGKGATVYFEFANGEKYYGEVAYIERTDSYYISLDTISVDELFDKIGVIDIYDFAEEAVGYPTEGVWPEVSDLNHFMLLFNAMERQSRLDFRIVKIEKETPLRINSIVTFRFHDGLVLKGKVSQNGNGYFIIFDHHASECHKLFNKLGVSSAEGYVSNIVGYSANGMFPSVKSTIDLAKVLAAMENTESEDLCISSVSEKPFKLEVKKSKSIKLNFKL